MIVVETILSLTTLLLILFCFWLVRHSLLAPKEGTLPFFLPQFKLSPKGSAFSMTQGLKSTEQLNVQFTLNPPKAKLDGPATPQVIADTDGVIRGEITNLSSDGLSFSYRPFDDAPSGINEIKIDGDADLGSGVTDISYSFFAEISPIPAQGFNDPSFTVVPKDTAKKIK